MTSAHNSYDVRIFHKECTSLAEAGHDVYLVAGGNSRNENGVHVIGAGEIPSRRTKRMFSFARKIYNIAIELDCDIYHFHDPELLLYGLILKKKGKAVVFDSHELTREQIKIKTYLPVLLTKVIAFLYTKCENYVLKRIDGVIFPCLISGKFPLPGKHVSLLNNVPRLNEFYNIYDPSATKKYDVGMAGSLTRNRGITHMIKAINMAGCNAYIGGVFDTVAFENEIKELASDKVHFLGYLNRAQVIDLVKKSRIGCSALLNVGQYASVENFSTKVYEYMSMAVPVILSNAKYNVDMVKKYKFGICIDPENLTDYRDAICYLLDHPDMAKEMGRNGRKAIKEEYNWEREVQKLFQLYEIIMEENDRDVCAKNMPQ